MEIDPRTHLSPMEKAVYIRVKEHGKARSKEVAGAPRLPGPSVRRVLQQLRQKGLVKTFNGKYESKLPRAKSKNRMNAPSRCEETFIFCFLCEVGKVDLSSA
jgi:predicted ArsR family transcriptional regulator